MVHKKTHTIYQISELNNGSRRRSSRLQSIQLEWKPIRQLPIKNSHDRIHSFTRDYCVTSKEEWSRHRIQCIRSGRIVDLPKHIPIFHEDLAIVRKLFNCRVEKLICLDSMRQSIEDLFM